jgi:hypothetical protein
MTRPEKGLPLNSTSGGTMAGLDEKTTGNDERLDNRDARKGDVLGLGGLEVPKVSDPSDYEPESTNQRPESPRVGNVLGLAENGDELTAGGDTAAIDKRRRVLDAD